MKSINSTIKILALLITIITSLFLLNLVNSMYLKPLIRIDKQEAAINFNSHFFSIFNLGIKRLLSDILWIQTLLESDLDHYKGKDLNGWMFLRFNTITTLDPLFWEAYVFGGQYLSIIKDDKMGAKFIFDRGILHYPNDYFLNFYAGFHYYFELNDPMNSIRYFKNIINHPRTPPHIKSLTARISAENGDLETAYNLIEMAYKLQIEDGPLKKRYFDSMNSIKIEKDLSCLNSKLIPLKENCSRKDLYGNLYEKNDKGIYLPPSTWKPFRPYRLKRN